jgi:uncharacterized membrane protein YbhN (UPF0104 family)
METYERPTGYEGQPTLPARRLWVTLVKWACFLAVLGWVGQAFVRQFMAVDWSRMRFSAAYAAAAMGLYLLAKVGGLVVQRSVLWSLGSKLGWQKQAASAWVPQLGKYVPGKVAGVMGMVYMLSRWGVRASAAASMVVITVGLFVVTGLLVSVPLTLWQPVRGYLPLAWLWCMLLSAVGLVCLHPRVFAFVANFFLRKLKRPVITMPPLRKYWEPLFLSFLQWIILGLALWMVVRSLGEIAPAAMVFLIAATALSQSVGLLAVFAPAGMGVREGMLLVILGPVLGADTAAVAIVLSRLGQILADVLAAGVGIVLWRRCDIAPPQLPVATATTGRLIPGPLLELPAPSPKARWRWEFAVVCIVLVVYALSYSPQWWIGSDSALYLNLARNLVRGNGYTLAGEPHVHVPPGFPAFLAGMMRLGLGSIAAMNLAIGLMGLATIYVGYRLLSHLVGWTWLWVVTATFALSREMIERSGEVLSDMPFMLLVVAALWLYYRGLRQDRPSRRGWELASLLLVAACWVRAVAFPLNAGVMVGLLLSGWNKARARTVANVLLLAVGMGASAAFFAWYVAAHGSSGASTYFTNISHAAGRVGGVGWLLLFADRFYVAGGQISRFFLAQRLPLPLAMLIVAAPMAAAMIRRMGRGDWLGPMATLAYVGGLCLVVPIVRTRYFLPLAPLLILYLLEGWAWFVRAAVRVKPAAVTAVIVLAAVMVAMNLPMAGRDIVSKHRADYFTHQQNDKYAADLKVAEFLREHRPPAGRNILGGQVLAYLADLESPAYSRRMADSTPSAAQMAEFLKRWRVVYVVAETDKEGTAMDRALAAYLGGFAPPIFACGGRGVYAVPPEAIGAASGPASRP